jgi:hypothetical protein
MPLTVWPEASPYAWRTKSCTEVPAAYEMVPVNTAPSLLGDRIVTLPFVLATVPCCTIELPAALVVLADDDVVADVDAVDVLLAEVDANTLRIAEAE